MMKCVLILILAVSTTLCFKNNGRIVGGFDANAGEFPWHVAVFATTTVQKHICAGALINNQWVVTAAQCVTNPKLFAVHLGTIHSDLSIEDPNRKVFVTTTVFSHPDFNDETLENDIALLRFHMPVEFTDYIKPIELGTADVGPSAFLIATGWGQTNNQDPAPVDRLHYVGLVALSNEECQLTYGSAIKDTMLCAVGNNNEGTCIGDMGGPLVNNDVLVGISSFLSSNGCETPDPSGFTRISAYSNWINQTIADYESEHGKLSFV